MSALALWWIKLLFYVASTSVFSISFMYSNFFTDDSVFPVKLSSFFHGVFNVLLAINLYNSYPDGSLAGVALFIFFIISLALFVCMFSIIGTLIFLLLIHIGIAISNILKHIFKF